MDSGWLTLSRVHIAKKAKKWTCVICNEKQSLQKVYFQGSGKDCRINVQKLNSMTHSQTNFNQEVNTDFSHNGESNLTISNTTCHSKWSKYLDAPTETAQTKPNVSSGSYNKNNSNDHLKLTLPQNTNVTETLVTFDSDKDTVNKNVTYRKTIETNTLKDNSTTCNDSSLVKDSNYDLMQIEGKTTESKNIFESHDDIDVSLDF